MLNRRKGIPGTILNWNDKVRQIVGLTCGSLSGGLIPMS